MSINLQQQAQVARWKRLVDSVDKTEFATEFIDKIHISYNTDTKLPRTIDVKKLKALGDYIDIDQIDEIINVALIDVQEQIKHIDLTVDIEAVMAEAIPVTEHYLSKLNS